MFRIFQAIELREQTRYLSSAFAWHLLVAAIPLLSCLRQPVLRADAQHSLDSLEASLKTLGTVRPAAANNLKSVQAIRKALNGTHGSLGSVSQADQQAAQTRSGNIISSAALLETYGSSFVSYHHKVVNVLTSTTSVSATESIHEVTQRTEISTPRDYQLTLVDGSTNTLADFLQDDLLTNNFWMRDWIDELAST